MGGNLGCTIARRARQRTHARTHHAVADAGVLATAATHQKHAALWEDGDMKGGWVGAVARTQPESAEGAPHTQLHAPHSPEGDAGLSVATFALLLKGLSPGSAAKVAASTGLPKCRPNRAMVGGRLVLGETKTPAAPLAGCVSSPGPVGGPVLCPRAGVPALATRRTCVCDL